MPGFGHILSRIFFWSYERGTWQYDAAVILILVFVLATPTRWFHDQPQVGPSVNSVQVVLVSKSLRNALLRCRTICTILCRKPGLD
jgi:hypothetical protein